MPSNQATPSEGLRELTLIIQSLSIGSRIIIRRPRMFTLFRLGIPRIAIESGDDVVNPPLFLEDEERDDGLTQTVQLIDYIQLLNLLIEEDSQIRFMNAHDKDGRELTRLKRWLVESHDEDDWQHECGQWATLTLEVVAS